MNTIIHPQVSLRSQDPLDPASTILRSVPHKKHTSPVTRFPWPEGQDTVWFQDLDLHQPSPGKVDQHSRRNMDGLIWMEEEQEAPGVPGKGMSSLPMVVLPLGSRGLTPELRHRTQSASKWRTSQREKQLVRLQEGLGSQVWGGPGILASGHIWLQADVEWPN